jgi:UDP-N-acetylmuramoyl-tripeptide--D-alanyl-D-alanine ligase
VISLTLREVADIVGGRLSDGADGDTAVAGSVQTDSRLVTPGSVFFALPGATTDGRVFADQAVDKGAALIVAEHQVDVAIAVIVVADGVAALADLAREVVARVRALGRLSVVAVTGSNGKTTTKNMLRAILSAQGRTVAPDASFNNHVGAPISMLRVDESTRYLVVEMGASHKGEIAHLVSIARPDVGVVLAVGRAHVGEFGGIAAVARAKAEMVTHLSPTATAVLNSNDRRVVAMAGQTAASVRWFGRGEGAGVRAWNVVSDLGGTSFDVVIDERIIAVRLRIVGEHHAMNAAAALAAAEALGVDADEAIAALEAMPRAERWRMEMLTSTSGAVIINDAYNASPESMNAALHALTAVAPPGSRSVAVLGEMTELGASAPAEHSGIGDLVSTMGIQRLVVVGPRARDIYDAATATAGWTGTAQIVADADEAFTLLSAELGPDDVVLVKSSNSANLRFLGDRLAGVAP